MKKNIQIIFSAGLCLALLCIFGCKKQELATANPPKIVNLKIKGKTVNDTLEFVKNGKVVAKTNTANGDFEFETKVTVEDGGAMLQIRQKGHTEPLATRQLTSSPFDQEVLCYYDGENVYNNSVTLKTKGYSIGSTLEFVIDNKVVASGTGNAFPVLNIGVETGKNRQLQIRKKDDTAILLTKEILAGQPVQTLSFFYDGTRMFDKLDFATPANPANMVVSASFNSTLPVFNGPADLVLYQGKLGQNTNLFTVTDIRFELPADGSFSANIELPALPETGTAIKNVYSFKLVKRGTVNDLPYNTSNELQPIRPESGFFNGTLTFTPGGAAILVISDQKTVKTTGAPSSRGTTFGTLTTDIAPFFR